MITSCSCLAAAAEEFGDSRGCLMILIPQVARSGIVEIPSSQILWQWRWWHDNNRYWRTETKSILFLSCDPVREYVCLVVSSDSLLCIQLWRMLHG